MSGLRHRNVARDSGEPSSIMEKVKKFDAYSKPMEVRPKDPVKGTLLIRPRSAGFSGADNVGSFSYVGMNSTAVPRVDILPWCRDIFCLTRGTSIESDDCQRCDNRNLDNFGIFGVPFDEYGRFNGRGKEPKGQDVDPNEHHLSPHSVRLWVFCEQYLPDLALDILRLSNWGGRYGCGWRTGVQGS